MRLYHNLASLDLYRNYKKNLVDQNAAMGKISSGSKLNSSRENPNSIGRSELIRMQIRGADAASKNVQDGVSIMQTVDGALGSVSDSLARMKELTVQGSNGTLSNEDKQSIQKEIEQLKQHINEVGTNTEFNGLKMLGNNFVTDNNKPYMQTMMSGANVGDNIDIPMYNIRVDLLKSSNGSDISQLDVTDPLKSKTNLQTIDDAINEVNSMRSKYGALQNRFETAADNLSGSSEVLQRADSQLRDTDIAQEMMEFSKSGILVQSATALMAQTNKFPQDVLNILSRVK
ncbi:flagellin [Clostridium folliculivorans]|uniref:Flagellin n=1 Tax=Clostridium folliculivorans TaxID=2886038 RepID=A0A9W6D962_9CLOT|nr:flagellin [Clostridium folliculivorans]GKU23566.1 flagellin [Clostridium folliculivorans]GKU29682.1 flagellin [Clostridium folliculivorans]